MTDLPPLPVVTLTDHPLIDNVPMATPGGTPPANPPQATAPPPDPNEVRLVVNGVTKTGWQEVMITRGIEIMPSNFAIAVTDGYSGDSAQTPLKKGDECKVFIGDDPVLTGRIDRVRRRTAQDGATLVIVGRSLCRNLVDCCVDPAQVPNMQISSASAADVITKLAATYKIKTNVLGGVGANIIPQFNFNLGERVYPIIDRIARASQFLAYDERDGSLNLAPVGTGAMASGFTEGVNIEPGATYEEGVDQRYSDYEVYFTSTYSLSDIAPLTPLQLVKDPTITEFRKLIVIADQNQLDPSLAQKRGVWEMVRRYGRSTVLTLTTDTWRDSAKTLWTVNTKVPVTAPHLGISKQQFLIAQVRFRRGAAGTHADLVLMPPGAFAPEPIVLTPIDAETANARARAGAT